MTEVEIEFIEDWKCCWHKGDRRAVAPHFAAVMIELGIARAVDPSVIIGDAEGAAMRKTVVMVSDCCGAKVKVSGPSPDFIGDDPKTMKVGTCFFVCVACGKACNIVTKAVREPERNKMMTAPNNAK